MTPLALVWILERSERIRDGASSDGWTVDIDRTDPTSVQVLEVRGGVGQEGFHQSLARTGVKDRRLEFRSVQR